MRKIIFVAGIHGVGTTTICRELNQRFYIDHYSASELISQIKHETFGGKQTKEINGNQDLLKTAMDLYLTEEKLYLLDGHFCLIDYLGGIARIPKDAFENIAPIAIILIVDSIENIVSRLTSRDAKEYDFYRRISKK